MYTYFEPVYAAEACACRHTLDPNLETRNTENEQKLKSNKYYKTQTKQENILKHY